VHRPVTATLIGLSLFVAACASDDRASPVPSSAPPTANVARAPTPAPDFGLTWGLVEDLERPLDAFTIPSDLPTAPSGPGTAGHPGTSSDSRSSGT
jgi:hypothetical protein